MFQCLNQYPSSKPNQSRNEATYQVDSQVSAAIPPYQPKKPSNFIAKSGKRTHSTTDLKCRREKIRDQQTYHKEDTRWTPGLFIAGNSIMKTRFSDFFLDYLRYPLHFHKILPSSKQVLRQLHMETSYYHLSELCGIIERKEQNAR